MSQPIKQEIRTDIVGTYLANIFADGHVETDPPGRPLSKEDLQRKIRDDEALRRAKKMLANERGRYTRSDAQLGTPSAQLIARAEFDVINGNLATAALSDAVRNNSTFSQTATANSGQMDGVVSTISLGGDVVDSDPTTEFIPESVRAVPLEVRGKGFTIQRANPELRREQNNG